MPDGLRDIVATKSDLPASDLIGALRERAPRVALALAATQAAWPFAVTIKNRANGWRTFTVKVSSHDDVYDDLHDWVLSLLPPGRQRALVAWSSRSYRHVLAPDGRPSREESRLRLHYDGSREQSIRVGGHKIKVQVSEGSSSDGESKSFSPPEIIFTAMSASARDALLDGIREVLALSGKRRRRPQFRMLDKWGDWTRLDDLPPRPLDSVVLPAGQLERITGDVSRFLQAEADYVSRGIPWHRGHLYEGPPGTGKTSVALAVAGHLGMDIWYLPLADISKDSDLIRMITMVTPRSMLLLEDADVFRAATERKEKKRDGKVTLSGLLNSLDGIATPHGLVTVMTTNRAGALDDAVVREGRVDLREHFALADDDQVIRLISRYYGEPATGLIPSGMSPAAVIEACKRNDTMRGAVDDLRKRDEPGPE